VDLGTNYLIGTSPVAVKETFSTIVEGHGKNGDIPPLWDGKAAERIVEILAKIFPDYNEAEKNCAEIQHG
jgi:UDP-N-acetylglucosamine 2-epimerase (non-hydrolysing)